MSNYDQENIDYPVLMTNAPNGVHQNCEYTLGASNTTPLLYVPRCHICDDENGDPIYKGVLKVDIVCSECTVGAENSEAVKQGTESDNVYYNISYWGNAETAEGYHTLNKSTAYNLTINPATGDVCSKSFTAVSNVTSQQYTFPNCANIYGNGNGGFTFYDCDDAAVARVTTSGIDIEEGYCLDTRRIVNTDGDYDLVINAGSMSTLALCGKDLTFNGEPIGTSSVNGNYNWASVAATPRASEIRQYLINNGGVKARLDGTTLFLTTNNWT